MSSSICTRMTPSSFRSNMAMSKVKKCPACGQPSKLTHRGLCPGCDHLVDIGILKPVDGPGKGMGIVIRVPVPSKGAGPK